MGKPRKCKHIYAMNTASALLHATQVEQLLGYNAADQVTLQSKVSHKLSPKGA